MYAKGFYGFLILEFSVFLELEVLRNSSTQETISHVINKFIWEIKFKDIIITVFENRPKSRIQYCERSELRLRFEWTKVNKKCQKWSWIQTVNLIGQKLMKNPKIEKNATFKWFFKHCDHPQIQRKIFAQGKIVNKGVTVVIVLMRFLDNDICHMLENRC